MKFIIVALAVVSATSMYVSGAEQGNVATLSHQQSSEKKDEGLWWAPWWRERGDCGPIALFVLMKLQGERVSVGDIKNITPLDPDRGCSIADLSRTAKRLGMQTELRFVNPCDIGNVPRPFILHGVSSIEQNLGHFIVIVDYDPKKKLYAAIDPVRERLWWSPEYSILDGYSGYVLVPRNPASQNWARLTSYSMLFGGLAMLLLWCYDVFGRRRSRQSLGTSNADVICGSG
jgi:hypothetical protein